MENLSSAAVYLLGAPAAGGVDTGVTTGSSIPVFPRNAKHLVFYLASQGTTSGGTVVLEECHYSPEFSNPYTGTWSLLQTVNASTFSGGAQIAAHFGPNAFAVVRARISSNITGGGTVSVVVKWS